MAKLVRDRIPEILKKKGEQISIRKLKPVEVLPALLAKLKEETQEVVTNPCGEELADVMEVVYAIGKQLGLSPNDIEQFRVEKNERCGSFEQTYFMEK